MEERQFFNEMPRPTFRWLRVNHYESQAWQIDKQGPSTVTISGDVETISPLEEKGLLKVSYEGVNRDVLQIARDAYREGHKVHVKKGEKKEITVTCHLKANSPSEVLRLRITAEEDAQLHLTYVLGSDDDFKGIFHLLTEIDAQKNSSVTVKKVQLFNEDVQQFEHRYTKIGEEAQVEFVSVELGGQENIYNFDNDLDGKKANLTHRFAYLGDKAQHFDINMLMTHRGKKSTCEIHNLGALTEEAKKTFRGTLDFLKGCTGAEGSEEDTCLLMNDTVKSISVPLLLCKEDDVVGNHAASAGQMDPNKLFYLMSRGFSEDEAKHMLVESMLRPIVDLIGLEEVEGKALDLIRHKI